MTSPGIIGGSAPALAFERLRALRIPITFEVACYAVVFAFAIGFRLWDLGASALHHDESIHAQWSWDLARGQYTHNPIFHGPLYYHAQALVFQIFGASDYTSRLSAALFGIVLCALPLLLRRRLGPVGTLAAVAFIAFSPTIVYYSRFMREDIYMAMFTMLMAAALWRYIDGGRDRWLIVFALALAGSLATKEATFLIVAIFLLYTNAMIAISLAEQTLANRQATEPWRKWVLAAGLFPYAWAIVALWPMLGGIRKGAAWAQLPRAGDVLIILGTLIVPLLAPVLKSPLESLGVVNAGQLDWPGVCQSAAATAGNNQLALGGIFLMACAGSAFIGLQWRPRTWAIAAGGAALLYLTLMTTVWTNFGGLCSGPWGSLDYWLSQQEEYRGNQPWFYYFMLMPAYEFLPLLIAGAGIWWATFRGNAFSRFLVFWIAGTWITLSWAGEKMPWLNTHIALPTALLAAWTIQRAWNAWDPKPDMDRRLALNLLGIGIIAAAAVLLAAFLPGGPILVAIRLALVAAVVPLAVFFAKPFGKAALPTFLIVVLVGAMAFFSLRTMVMVSYVRGDVPKDLLIYTQSSPEIPKLMADIERLAAATGKGYDLPIAIDSADSFAWPWAWYLRDYKAVSYADFRSSVPSGEWDVMLINESNVSRVNDHLSGLASQPYATPERYPHRWWYDETYKQQMSVVEGQACTASGGECGPFKPWVNIGSGTHLGAPNVDVLRTLWTGVTERGFLSAWFHYWRDHDPGRPPGSINGFAYFPANFDRETGQISVEPVEVSEPTEDSEGRPVFGGLGFAPGQFFGPIDIAGDAEGNLYIVDRTTRRLQKFDAAGNYVAGVDVRGPGGTGDSEPWGVTVAPDGRVVVADTFGWKIRVFDANLQPLTEFGDPPVSAEPGPFDLFGPRDAVVAPDGNLWVTDTGHDRIQVYTLEGEYVRTVGSSGSGPGQLDEPVGLAVSEDGTLAVADMLNGRVQFFDVEGNPTGEFPVQGWGGEDVTDKPYLQFLDDGRIALSLPGLNDVRVYSATGELEHSFVADANLAEPLEQPYGLLPVADGKLWVVEGGSGRVRLFDLP